MLSKAPSRAAFKFGAADAPVPAAIISVPVTSGARERPLECRTGDFYRLTIISSYEKAPHEAVPVDGYEGTSPGSNCHR
jgi:hypothetical protein